MESLNLFFLSKNNGIYSKQYQIVLMHENFSIDMKATKGK